MPSVSRPRCSLVSASRRNYVLPSPTPSPRSGAGGGWAGFAGGGLLRVGREERSAPGLRLLSRPRIRSSRGRAGALVGWDGCEVRLSVCPVFVPCPVCVPAPPCVFLPVRLPSRSGFMKLVVRYKYETRRMAFVEFGIARLAALARDHGFFLTSLTRVTPDPSLLIFPNEFTYPPPRPLIGGSGRGSRDATNSSGLD